MKKKQLFPMLLAFGFILGIHDGRIALWREGEAAPAEVFPYRAEMLPEKDQQALRRGVVIADDSSLAQILEDYLS